MIHFPSGLRPSIDADAGYADPTHLRESLEGLPAAPGVYIFHGEEGDLPLYIGKSVNLRQRVLSHLRNPEEAQLLSRTRRISHIRTFGEIGALLLESRLIKEQQPLMNQKLRRVRQLCALRLAAGVPEVVFSSDLNFATEPALFGLYPSRHAALEALRDLADRHRLCYGALGLERLAPGRPCFRASIRQCAGVCRGDESPAEHHARLLQGLDLIRVACWPYPGAVGLVEREGRARQIHVIRHWCYLGSAPALAAARKLDRVVTGFDADGYKILCRPLLTGRAEIIAL